MGLSQQGRKMLAAAQSSRVRRGRGPGTQVWWIKDDHKSFAISPIRRQSISSPLVSGLPRDLFGAGAAEAVSFWDFQVQTLKGQLFFHPLGAQWPHREFLARCRGHREMNWGSGAPNGLPTTASTNCQAYGRAIVVVPEELSPQHQWKTLSSINPQNLERW